MAIMRSWLLLPVTLLLAFIACDEWPGVGDGDGGTSVPGGGTRIENNSGGLGSSCSTSAPCQTGLVCLTQMPNGMCTRPCTTESDCSGASCQVVYGGMFCIPTCTSDLVCRSSYSCLSTGTATLCLPTPAAKDW